MSANKEITFLQTRTIAAPDAPDEVFKCGSRHKLSDASCFRWIRRGAAKYTDKLTNADMAAIDAYKKVAAGDEVVTGDPKAPEVA